MSNFIIVSGAKIQAGSLYNADIYAVEVKNGDHHKIGTITANAAVNYPLANFFPINGTELRVKIQALGGSSSTNTTKLTYSSGSSESASYLLGGTLDYPSATFQGLVNNA